MIKLGGSLLDADDVFERLERWIDAQPVMHNVLIVGGGKLVDGLRDLHQRFGLDERDSHWLAVDLLEVTAGIASGYFSSWPVRHSMAELLHSFQSAGPTNQIFVTGDWLRSQPNVPESWDVTTDSIAALLANQLNAQELVLLKSATADKVSGAIEDDISRLSQSGYVDAWFSNAFRGVSKLRLVNLRDDDFAETDLSVDQA